MTEPEVQPQDLDVIESSPDPHVEILLKEFKQAGTMPNGFYDVTYNEETRRLLWAGQSPDGRRWDENNPEGKQAKPWDGASDTRVALVDGVINEDVDLLTEAFWRAELRATANNANTIDLAGAVSTYLHWLRDTKLRKELALNVELSVQYTGEYGWCAAYIGWERKVGKRRINITLAQLAQAANLPPGTQVPTSGPGQNQGPTAVQALVQGIQDPSREDEMIGRVQQLYTGYVQRTLNEEGWYHQEISDQALTTMSAAAARRAVRELRTTGETRVPFPYLCKNGPLVFVMKPYLEFLAARGTAQLKQARVAFWRRWMSEAEIDSQKLNGWDPDWCLEVKKTRGNISSWAGALGQTSLTGPATKTVAGTTYLKITEENNPLIEVVYAYREVVDDDGVTEIYETIFSPHITKQVNGQAVDDTDFYAKHGPVDTAHGHLPFEESKRENLGRSLVETRSVAEIAGTWQGEKKNQRDMLFNRAQLDTLPPVAVPKLGGVDYRLGPGMQVPVGRSGQDIKAINLGAPAPSLAIELLQGIDAETANYFGLMNAAVLPQRLQTSQARKARAFYGFWSSVFLQMLALAVRYNPEEVAAVSGSPELAQMDPSTIMDELQVSVEFDVRELNPDFMEQKLKAIDASVVPTDVTGAIDRNALTQVKLRMLDPLLARTLMQDKTSASQALFREVQNQVALMALGNEAEYVENDPTAPTKLQNLQAIVKGNPKYLAKLGAGQDPATPPDERFQELLQNYAKNLQMSVMQQQNKQVGRIGVAPVGGGQT